MAKFKLNITNDASFMAFIEINNLNKEGEIVPKNLGDGFFLSNFLKKFTGEKYSLGKVDIIFDFDENGEVSALEIYQ
ncbi:hypothetical protein [Bartonella sp. HY761]|uniref:hypothetical protein n=1 Tax=Bartonella sp. HY761 TaxID=2979330 RepID=UPI00220A4BB8|nr:hypothetical protein [Bartonella sp. HY761]UXN06922.1 hypothetical protein N6A79_02620 [Bartonella sp. HY761]